MEEQEFCLRWSNHEKNMSAVMEAMYKNQILVDVTLTCTDGQPVKAHRTVLSACSPYFETVFKDLSHSHPIIFMKDVRHEDLKALLNFMYKGEVNVKQNRLNSFIKLAEALSVRGLSKSEKGESSSTAPTPPCPPLKEIASEKRSPPSFMPHPQVPHMPMYFPTPPPMMVEKALQERFVTNSILEESLRKRKRFENESMMMSSGVNNNEGSPCSAVDEPIPAVSLKEKSLSAIAAQLHQKKILAEQSSQSSCPPFTFPPKFEPSTPQTNDVKTEYDDFSPQENSDEPSDEESVADDFPSDIGSQSCTNEDSSNAGPSGNPPVGVNGGDSPVGEKARLRVEKECANQFFETSRDGRWSCKICSKTVIHRFHHYKVHMADRKFVCSVCNSEFSRRDNCYKHVKNVHSDVLGSEPTSNLIRNVPLRS